MRNNRDQLGARKHILRIIKKLKLDLRGLVVLTEAASGSFIHTPLIAAMAGADKVYALTKDSRYGKARDVASATLSLARRWHLAGKIKIFQNELPGRIISQADIVTNLGFLRPLDKIFIGKMKESAVIPLMYESYEFRGRGELDLKAAWRRGIPVLGTNEIHPLEIWDYWGVLAVHKLREIGKRIKGKNIALVADRLIRLPIRRHLSEMGAFVWKLSKKSRKRLAKSDILIIAIHDQPRWVIGRNGLIGVSELKKINPHIFVLQMTGTGMIDRTGLDHAGISYCPTHDPGPRQMSWTFGDLGPKPVIELHAVGLKVGEVMAKARKRGFDFKKTIRLALKNSPARDFSVTQKKRYGLITF